MAVGVLPAHREGEGDGNDGERNEMTRERAAPRGKRGESRNALTALSRIGEIKFSSDPASASFPPSPFRSSSPIRSASSFLLLLLSFISTFFHLFRLLFRKQRGECLFPLLRYFPDNSNSPAYRARDFISAITDGLFAPRVYVTADRPRLSNK